MSNILSKRELKEDVESFEDTTYPICPYCKYAHEGHTPTKPYLLVNHEIVTCINCDEEFDLFTDISISYSTSNITTKD